MASGTCLAGGPRVEGLCIKCHGEVSPDVLQNEDGNVPWYQTERSREAGTPLYHKTPTVYHNLANSATVATGTIAC